MCYLLYVQASMKIHSYFHIASAWMQYFGRKCSLASYKTYNKCQLCQYSCLHVPTSLSCMSTLFQTGLSLLSYASILCRITFIQFLFFWFFFVFLFGWLLLLQFFVFKSLSTITDVYCQRCNAIDIVKYAKTIEL